jgi:pimeloyl-ACP methyl ester carboxylesterase
VLVAQVDNIADGIQYDEPGAGEKMANATTLERRTVRGHGLNLVMDVAGAPENPPVVFLHGGGQTRASWGEAVRRVAEAGFYAMSVDARGHGESEWSPDSVYGVDLFAADLKAIIATLRERPLLVGASLGGMTSLITIGEAKEPIARGLVLVDITPRAEKAGTDRIRAFMHGRPEGFASIDEVVEAVATYLPHRKRPPDPSGLMKNLRLGADGRYRWHWDPKMFAHRDADNLEQTYERIRNAAAQIKIPALLVRGALSRVVSDESVREFKELVPHAEYVTIEGADHMVAGDANDAFNNAVIDFLIRHRSG